MMEYTVGLFILFTPKSNIGNESDTELAEIILKASGPMGSNYQYVLNMAECLRNINVTIKKAKSVFAIEKRIKSLLKGNEPT